MLLQPSLLINFLQILLLNFAAKPTKDLNIVQLNKKILIFQEVLQKQAGEPLIILKMRFSVLKCLVEFMYCGKTQCLEENLDELVAAAQFLKIKGLSKVTKEGLGIANNSKTFFCYWQLPKLLENHKQYIRMDNFLSHSYNFQVKCLSSLHRW